MFHFVTNSTKKVNSFLSSSIKKYVMSLLISTGKKNCAAMASDIGVPYSSIYRYFDDFEYQKNAIKNFSINAVHQHSSKENPGILVVDSTQIVKLYAKQLKCICYDFSNTMKLVVKGISCVTAAWTNGKILIPLDFDFWMRRKDLKNDAKYKKKTEISKELILEWKNKIPFAYIALDGEYGNEPCLRFLHENKLKFSIRIPKNRKVVIGKNNAQLKNQPTFKLKKNEKYKTAKGTYKGVPAYFTSHKRKGKKGTKQVVFVVSNLENLTPKQHILAYSLRWPIEKMFRTLKQSLGIQHCQSNSIQKQRAHIFATFLAFTELEIQKIAKRKKSPEQVLKIIKLKKRLKLDPEFHLLEGFVM